MSQLQRDLKQNRPFKSLEEEAYLSLVRTAGQLTDELAAVLKPYGLSEVQYNVLRILRGSHPEPMATLEIAERMIERAPGITRMLDRLEAAGWVTRRRCHDDRRRVLCGITAAGLAQLAKADGPVLDTEERLAKRLGRADQARLIELLEALQEESS